MNQPPSPFKFLDSYTREDAAIFFGREKETEDLYQALNGVKHLLVYGPSGAGKTSLVECGLRNQFSDADWFALTIRRGNNINKAVFATLNAALTNKFPIQPETQLPEEREVEFGQAVERLFTEKFQPVYLLFDQFEELLITGEEEERIEFFKRLNLLIRYKIPCRVMLIMREEFLGHLSEFEPYCPSIFQHRFRLEKMGRRNVSRVLLNILEAPGYQTSFRVDDAPKLAERILSKLPDSRREIELTHLQVFLSELWERAVAENEENTKPVFTPNLIGERDNLETVLDGFLKKQLGDLDAIHGEKITLELLAAMISERNTKLQLKAPELEEDLQQKQVRLAKPLSCLLQDLEKRRIIRTIKTGEETSYEISHDVLAQVVGQNLTEEMKMREKAEGIYELFEERSGYLSAEDLDYIRPFDIYRPFPEWLKTKVAESESRIKYKGQMELQQTKARLRRVYAYLAAILILLGISIFISIYASRQQQLAEKNAQRATAEGNRANKALNEYRKEQSAKAMLEFQALESRVKIILEGEGCPDDLFNEMARIAGDHPDSNLLRAKLNILRNTNRQCQ